MYESPFGDFSFVEKCKKHGIPLTKYSWGDACSACIKQDYLFWENGSEPFIHKHSIVTGERPPSNPNDLYYILMSFAQALPDRQMQKIKMQQAKEFVQLMNNTVTPYYYSDMTEQKTREGCLLLRGKTGKIVANITIERNPQDVKRSFV